MEFSKSHATLPPGQCRPASTRQRPLPPANLDITMSRTTLEFSKFHAKRTPGQCRPAPIRLRPLPPANLDHVPNHIGILKIPRKKNAWAMPPSAYQIAASAASQFGHHHVPNPVGILKI